MQDFGVHQTSLSELGGAFPCWNSSVRVRMRVYRDQRERDVLLSVLAHDASSVVLRMDRQQQLPQQLHHQPRQIQNDDDMALAVHTTCASSSHQKSVPATCCCHEWSNDGRFLIVTSDQTLLWYDVQAGSYECCATFTLRYAINSLSIHAIQSHHHHQQQQQQYQQEQHQQQQDQEREVNGNSAPTNACDTAYLVAIGTNFGCFLFRIKLLPTPQMELVNVPVEQVVVNVVTFAANGAFLGLGTMDGRFILHDLAAIECNLPINRPVLAVTLASPRVTSVQFSHCNVFVAVATRQGNVYVFKQSADGVWGSHNPCQKLTRTPKCTGRACSTLVSWWGNSPFLAIAGRDGTATLEVFEVWSGLLCHRLELGVQGRHGSPPLASCDRDQVLSGLDCLTEYDDCLDLHLCTMVCLDSSSVMHLVTWSFINTCYGNK